MERLSDRVGANGRPSQPHETVSHDRQQQRSCRLVLESLPTAPNAVRFQRPALLGD